MLTPPSLRLLSPAHPLWYCAMRPFFLLGAVSAVGLLALWTGMLAVGWPVPAVAGGPLAWHAHEMLFGFALAAVAGFVLTAVPEFTSTPEVPLRRVRLFVALWLLGRLGFWSSGLPAPWGGAALLLAAAAHTGLLLGLAATIAPRIWADPGRRHLSFVWVLLAWTGLAAGFYAETWQGGAGLRWLNAAQGLLAVLVVVSMSRISMRIVNRAIEEAGLAAIYLARPPRRHLATLCIVLYSGAEFFFPAHRVTGWLALAAAAALFNLQGDWHVGRPLLRRWPLMLYLAYVFMASGYALAGVALLSGSLPASAGKHLLAIGGIGLGIYMANCIAGRAHCGLAFDNRLWAPLGAALLACAALLRAAVPWLDANALAGAGLCWIAAFALLLFRLGPVLVGPRSDGRSGCAGPGGTG